MRIERPMVMMIMRRTEWLRSQRMKTQLDQPADGAS